MTKKGLESNLQTGEILSERRIFREYIAYINGELPDELGTRGKRIMDQAQTVSRILGYQSVNDWVEACKNPLDTLAGRYIPQKDMLLMEQTYKQIIKLGRTKREVNQAVGMIESFENSTFQENVGGRYYLKEYAHKRQIISNFVKNYKDRVKVR
jgi:hypothetical protein